MMDPRTQRRRKMDRQSTAALSLPPGRKILASLGPRDQGWLPGNPARYNPRMARVAARIRVQVLYFGPLRELAGCAEDSVEVEGGASVADVFEACSARHAAMGRFRSAVVPSRNREFASWPSEVAPGDEVAFLPPVSGG